MFQFFSSFGASSNFQKHRLILTTKDYQSPDQTSLKKIIQTFRGQDQQTRSQIAFATIVKKIHTSDSSDNWIYLLKNLIILDKVVEENCFLDQIANLVLKPIQTYQQKHQNAKALNSQRILKYFWKLIQSKSTLMCQRSSKPNESSLKKQSKQQNESRSNNLSKDKQSLNKPRTQHQKRNSPLNKQRPTSRYLEEDTQRSILSILRSQKQQFLKTLTIQQIYKQSKQLEGLFDCIFKVILSIEHSSSGRNKNSKSSTSDQNDSHNTKEQINGQNNNLLKKNQGNFPNKLIQTKQNQIRQNSYSDSKYDQKYRTIRQQFFNSKLVSYLHLQLIYKLLLLYTNQLFCIKSFINQLTGSTANSSKNINAFTHSSPINKVKRTSSKQIGPISEKDVNLWKKIILNFLTYSQRIINYVQRHKHIKGFQLINYNQLSPFQNLNIIAMLDEYIQHKNTLQQPSMVKVQQLGSILGEDSHIRVQKKSVQWGFQKSLTARRIIDKARNLKDKNNPFYNWQNGFSSNFPPKQVLTVDLIMQIRQNPRNPATQAQDQEQQSIYSPFVTNRHSCIYNFRESNISLNSQFEFVPVGQMIKKVEEGMLQSTVSKKNKNFYYFRPIDKQDEFKNVYSSIWAKGNAGWVK